MSQGLVCCSYVRPEIVGDEEQPQLVIKGGRHPVLAAMSAEGQVVPNDTLLMGDSGPRACIITGPNMGCTLFLPLLFAVTWTAWPAGRVTEAMLSLL